MMMVAEKKIACVTSLEAWKIVASLPVRPSGVARRQTGGVPWLAAARWRKMFSTMITVASTMMPKSIAPIDSRLANSPVKTRITTAKSRAKGMVADTIRALRRSPRNSHWIRKISTTPSTMLCSTVWVVMLTRALRS